MAQDQTGAGAEEKIALAKEYFRKVDAGDPNLLDMFTDDTVFFFPKFGFARGKAEIVPFLVGMGSAVASFDHPEARMTFTSSDNRVVVEGVESGRLTSFSPSTRTGSMSDASPGSRTSIRAALQGRRDGARSNG